MPFSEVNYSSKEQVWGTPQEFYDRLNAEFSFTLDPCALPENAKCERYYTPEIDGLSQAWNGVVFCNPPYGKGIDKWVRKAAESANEGATVVLLVFCRSDTKWFHDWVLPYASEIRFVSGRLKFGGAKNSAPSPSIVVVFRPGAKSFETCQVKACLASPEKAQTLRMTY